MNKILTDILKSCGRKRCLCSQKSIELALKLPISVEDEYNIENDMRILKKSYKGCRGSYFVMKENLEWDYETWDEIPFMKKYK